MSDPVPVFGRSAALDQADVVPALEWCDLEGLCSRCGQKIGTGEGLVVL
jgi:hypothetical protein